MDRRRISAIVAPLSRDFEVECVSRRSCERRMTDSIGALSRTFGKGRFTLTGLYNYFHNVSIIIYYELYPLANKVAGDIITASVCPYLFLME